MNYRLCVFTILILASSLLFATDPWNNPSTLTGSMTVMAQVSINDSPASSGDVLAAFVTVGGTPELRGKGNVQVLSGLSGCLLQVFTDNSGEVINFRVWDESAQQVLDASQTLVAVVDGTIGSYPSNLYQINADLQAQMVAMPEFSIPTGTYSTAQYVSLSCQTTDALIRYTTNGTEPALTSSLYNEAITIATTTTLKAKAFLTGWTPSATASSVYTFGSANPDNPDTPVVTGIFDVYPNPFSYATTIQLGVKEANQPYCLKIYNIKGELVYRTEGVAIGSFELNWNGYSNDGKRLPTGIYLISFSAGNTTQARKTVLK